PKDIGNPQVRRFVENQNRETYKKQVAEVNALYQEKLAAGLLATQAPKLPTGGGAEFGDRMLQTLGLPTIYGERAGVAPTIWGNPNPNAPAWQKALRGLARIPTVGIPIEMAARIANKFAQGKYSNQWWEWRY
ncbi:MAG: hypothetical protein M3R47_02100, partial [Chloroflexota bacterium]|nr:hypothetical protein [Chloroflexota bacterium]